MRFGGMSSHEKYTGWDLSWQEMVYNLYILHLRSMMLPETFTNFGMVDGKEMAYVEIPYGQQRL